MHYLKSIILSLFLISYLASCEEDFVLHKKEFVPSVVVNSVFTVNQPWNVNLSLSRDILEHGSMIQYIDNADVIVIENFTGRRNHLKSIGDGNYTSEFYLAQPDRIYELEVHVPGYDVIKAKSKSPKFSEVTISNVVESSEDKTTQVAFQINDLNSNFYIWNLVVSTSSQPIDTFYKGSPKELIYSIQGYNQLAGLASHFTNPLNDAEATGGDYISKHIDFQVEEDTTTSHQTKRYLRLITASKELYDYYKSVDKFNQNPIGSSLTITPEIFTNVNGGLGIFAGFSEKYHEITE